MARPDAPRPTQIPESESPSGPAARRRALLALCVVVPVPTLGAWMALIAAPGAVGQTVFTLSKLWILVVPWLWVRFVDGQRVRPVLRCPGWRVSLATGVLFAITIVLAYVLVARDAFDLDGIAPTLHAAGLDTRGAYLGLALYWTFINALLEEYVWRWFVAGKCEVLLPRAGAILLAAACFSIHHYVAIVAYASPGVAALGTLGVFAASVVWSWLYLRYRSVFTPYLSHVVADAAIFGVGYVIVFGG